MKTHTHTHTEKVQKEILRLYLFAYLRGRETERTPFYWFTPSWGLGQKLKPGAGNSMWFSRVGGRTQLPEPSPLSLRVCISKKPESGAGTGYQALGHRIAAPRLNVRSTLTKRKKTQMTGNQDLKRDHYQTKRMRKKSKRKHYKQQAMKPN